MGGGAGKIQRTTQHLMNLKLGGHIPLKQLNAMHNSISLKQGNTKSSERENNHYFFANNSFLKGLN